MMQRQKSKVEIKGQKEKFMAMAKELGEDSETAFNKVLKRVGRLDRQLNQKGRRPDSGRAKWLTY